MKILDLNIDLTFEITRDFGSKTSTSVMDGVPLFVGCCRQKVKHTPLHEWIPNSFVLSCSCEYIR